MPSGLPPGSWKRNSSKLENRRRGAAAGARTKAAIAPPPSRAKLPVPPTHAVALASIGVFFRSMRESFGMTLDQLAERTEAIGWPVARATIGALEKGKHSPSAVTVMGLTKALHVDAMEIFDRIQTATEVPEEFRTWSVEQLDARSTELFAERRFRETLMVLDAMMDRLAASRSDDLATKNRQLAVVEVRRATTLRRLGAIFAAKGSAERAIGLAAEHPDLMAQAYIVLVAAHLRLGNLPMGKDAADRAEELSRDCAGAIHGEALIERGRVLLIDRMHDEALRAFAEARDRAEEAGDEVHVITSTGNMGCCLVLMGRHLEAEVRFKAAVALAEKSRRPDLEARWLVEWGRLALKKKRIEEASHLGQRALGIAQRGEFWSVAFSAAMLLHHVTKALDPATGDRHRMSYLKKLRSWIEEDVADPAYREFVAEIASPGAARRREA